jgi:riboflavin transporter FmnP
MRHTSTAKKVILSSLIGVEASVGVLIAIAWVTRTPLYTLQAAERVIISFDCSFP